MKPSEKSEKPELWCGGLPLSEEIIENELCTTLDKSDIGAGSFLKRQFINVTGYSGKMDNSSPQLNTNFGTKGCQPLQTLLWLNYVNLQAKY